ncbi:YheC/YheD family protein [Paenibacillus donghaensis]|uniref:ATP-grasp domain-containing protein n=1 Tax=Paenibacillus donghaensis TaxID=414771 RepID=A0A2Z2KBE1_9BACL|nr:YheC/YheD family protein [Paenibacillus donghaensis]ASA20290.1 hypothetical protein B9T62_05435 [Paenibacillus donghaensis]
MMMNKAAAGLFGVMTGYREGSPPIAEPAFCTELCQAAPLYNLKVIVFHPDGVAADGTSVSGFSWSGGHWQKLCSPPPDVVFNRCFYGSARERTAASAAWAALPRAIPWSRGLPDKWGVHEILRRNRRAAALLPETSLYSGSSQLGTLLAEREFGLFLKPQAGSHGKRTLRAMLLGRADGGGLQVKGRDGSNKPIAYVFASLQDGLQWIDDFIGQRRYIIQPYLHLTSRSGQPFDVRVLMQKNGRGAWTLTGMAVRLGLRNSLTSNLHGGGTAVPLLPFLRSEYGPGGEELIEELAAEAAFLPPLLETACGRLGELGLDFGLDPAGRIYLLEANSKPGRTVFRLTGDLQAARLAAENPLLYARHLLLAQGRIPAALADSSITDGKMITMVPKEDS